jgi:predicted transposase/invertase (TIGR01784 family)
MGRDVVSAKLDVIFKKLFTDNPDLLKEFISDILDIPLKTIEDLVITNSEVPPENPEGKFSRMDLNLKLTDRLINIEIQVKNDSYYRDRTLFYWAKLYTSELKSGDSYDSLKQAITINIINFNMFDKADYHTEVVAALKDSGEIFSDKFSIHFFELKKVGKNLNPNNRKELWLQFLNANSEEEFEMLKQTNNPTINKAVSIIYDYSSDTQVREMARIREKALHDEVSSLKNARNEGIQEGIDTMIESMRESGFSEEMIQTVLNKRNQK